MTNPAAELDIEQPGVLIDWLRTQGLLEPTESPGVHLLAGGVSNRTVLVDRSPAQSWVVKQALAKLRVKVDWFSSPERIHREADGLRWLVQFAPEGAISPLVFEDHVDHIVGMVAVPQPHENWKHMLLRGELDPDHVRQFARLAGMIHARSHPRLADLETPFGDPSFFESLRVEPYYRYTASQIADSAGFYANLIDDMFANRIALVHGDFSPKNVLVQNNRLILLDHEVIHLGDPGFDLGFGLTHLLSKAHHVSRRRSEFLKAAILVWETYEESVRSHSGGEWIGSLESRTVRHTLGCMLARVRGRSPLEYMAESERSRQANIVLTLMQSPPQTVQDLASQFGTALDKWETHA